VLRLSCLYMVPSVVLMIWGQDLSDPMAAAIVFTTMPLVSAAIGAVQGTERVRASLLLGVGLAIAGGVLASGSFGEGAPGFRGGEIVLLVSITLWALFSRATVRDLDGHDSLAQSLVTLAAGGATLTLLSAGLTGAGWLPPVAPGWQEILLLLWMGCIGIGLSMPLWFLSVRFLGVTVASMHQNLLPFYVVVLAVLLGQGEMGGRTLAGAALVSLGALVAQLPWARMWRGGVTSA
jgi:drug/metabolite transporter (DMT)-like permease